MLTKEQNISALNEVVDLWYQGDKNNLQVKLQKMIIKAKKENNLKLVRLLSEDLKILDEVSVWVLIRLYKLAD